MVRKKIVMCALLLPTIASGADLELTLGVAAEYDSNVYRISDESDRSKQDDVVFRFVPTAWLTSDEGAFTKQLGRPLFFQK